MSKKIREALAKKEELNLNLVGLDGNAFALMGYFRKQALREGWTPGEIKYILDEARSGDYYHLVDTLSKYTKD